MALNLLDSLNSAATTSEKSPFSVKNKEGKEVVNTEFSQLFNQLAGQTTSGEVTDTDLGIEVKGGQTRPKVATSKDALTDALITDTANLSPAAPAEAAAAVVPPLTAVVLSPNMTAITPSQPTPDSSSLVAFAQSQGLDKHVAAWLMNAGAPRVTKADLPTADPGMNQEAGSTEAGMLPQAALLASILATPASRPAAAGTSASITDPTQLPVQIAPMSPPAAWLTQRSTSAGKSLGTAASAPTFIKDTDSVHSSDLDLSLIFAVNKDTEKFSVAANTSFTPAAWVMAGLSGDNAAALNSMTSSKLLSDSALGDEGLTRLGAAEGIPLESRMGAPKSGETAFNGNSLNSKGNESSMSVAERSEQHQAQAEKMGQAIGQRMISEMEKGHWHLKMMLRPANLGNIEVEMRLRNGELDANFTASQAVTRDLLQDGLPKLRDTLTQMGMDVASMHIGGGASQKNGGDPTPQQPRNGTSAAPSESEQEPSAAPGPRIASVDQDGLDVLV
jgi:flagellar hook-length control protein FliK